MAQETNDQSAPNDGRTNVERQSDVEVVVTRWFDVPAHILFDAWSRPELFSQWWIPASFGMTLMSCEMDVRVGGGYRLEIGHPASDQPMAFFGTYIEVVANQRIAWTNEESEQGAMTTVTFDEQDGRTKLVVRDLYPSKEVLDSEIASGATSGMSESLGQLDRFIAASAKP